MRNLILKKTIEFYDVPQLFVANDALNINYLCLLYDNKNGYEYIAVQLSELRLHSFLCGDFDLRKAYTEPEQDNSIFHITVKEQHISADKILLPEEIKPEMLPDAGYYCEVADEGNEVDTLQIDIPVKDRTLFANMAQRMGWTARTLKESASKIAIL